MYNLRLSLLNLRLLKDRFKKLLQLKELHVSKFLILHLIDSNGVLGFWGFGVLGGSLHWEPELKFGWKKA